MKEQDYFSEEEILRKRARQTALPREVIIEQSGIECLLFQLAYERYAIETKYIQEVIPLKEITPLPMAPKFVLGLINLRGEVMSVLDIRKFFDLPGEPLSDLNRVMILKDGPMSFGVLVDRIRGIFDYNDSTIIKNPATLGDLRKEYLLGITTDQIIIIDGSKLLNDRKIVLTSE